ncbi:MAG: exopolyphosphatase [Propionibacteriaceae bacterium]|nr:exopolyphosphatase [Propionibacteriaceae bacterium]
MRVGVIDCGTNTVRLLIADDASAGQVGHDPYLADLVRVLRFVRLGQGVDATHRFHPDALARTFAALDEFAALIEQHGPLDGLRFLATSAARDATNRDEFFAGVKARVGVDPEVISGGEEARLSFLGALAGGNVPGGSVVVMDIGGGSTELIRGDAAGAVASAQSFDVGSVRLRERFLHDDPPTVGQIAAARDYVASLVDGGDVPLDGVGTFIGVAGTNTSLSAMAQGLVTYDSMRVHNSSLTTGEISQLAGELLTSPVELVRARYPFLEPMRAEVICAGALICDEVAQRVKNDMLVRETDILDGAALDLLRRGGSPQLP